MPDKREHHHPKHPHRPHRHGEGSFAFWVVAALMVGGLVVAVCSEVDKMERHVREQAQHERWDVGQASAVTPAPAPQNLPAPPATSPVVQPAPIPDPAPEALQPTPVGDVPGPGTREHYEHIRRPVVHLHHRHARRHHSRLARHWASHHAHVCGYRPLSHCLVVRFQLGWKHPV